MPLPEDPESRKRIARALVSLMELPKERRKAVIAEVKARRQTAIEHEAVERVKEALAKLPRDGRKPLSPEDESLAREIAAKLLVRKAMNRRATKQQKEVPPKED